MKCVFGFDLQLVNHSRFLIRTSYDFITAMKCTWSSGWIFQESYGLFLIVILVG